MTVAITHRRDDCRNQQDSRFPHDVEKATTSTFLYSRAGTGFPH
jgi:hypothetical protein